MMLRSLADEVVRRRLWPVLLAAVLVAIAAPLLFMKSTPAGAPSASEVPAAATPGKLPTPAAKLVTTSDKAVVAHHAKSKRHDPFAPPSAAVQAAQAAATPAGATTAATKPAAKAKSNTKKATTKKQKAVPVVITNSDGSTIKASNPSTTTPNATNSSSAITGATSKSKDYVDVRFGAQAGSKIHSRVPRLKTFAVDHAIVAVFMKWSPKRGKAVFAIDPKTIVTGPNDCRRVAGVCRYIDIPVGSYARLTWLGADGSFVSRRLDVVKIHHG
ncbi:MAG TPA: hypothetical protein VHZ31_02855 [Solirubrobacteraceae bacterium]|nr:hypothetical protein [Solirubrobacteraceae bacterium]